MKELLLRGARYNAWANRLFTDIIRELPDAVLDQEIVSSFPSIRKTVIHMWSVESIWLQRLQRVANPVYQQFSFQGSLQEACDQWEAASAALIRLIETQPDESLFRERLAYTTLKGDSCLDETGAVLQQIFNHATYHRGQLTTMLRQAGVTDIPASDLILFERSANGVESPK